MRNTVTSNALWSLFVSLMFLIVIIRNIRETSEHNHRRCCDGVADITILIRATNKNKRLKKHYNQTYKHTIDHNKVRITFIHIVTHIYIE